MNLAQLQASRLLWLRRERAAYKKWKFYKFKSKRPAAERLRLRQEWWDKYEAARTNRVRRDRQLAQRKLNPTEVSTRCVELVCEFEGFSSRPYRDPVGVWTIGYGETRGISGTTKPWTEAYAKQQLRKRLNEDYAPYVSKRAKKGSLDQKALDGFTSFVYNVGPGGVSLTTKVGRALAAGRIREAAEAILAWDKAGGRVFEGLARRRRAERRLILGL